MRTATPARATLLIAVALLALAATRHANAVAHPPPAASAAAGPDCEGDACPSVTLTFDEARQQYHAQNNSAERWAQVSASNLASSASACLAPGKEGYLPLKSFVPPYRASFTEPRCGASDTYTPPAQ
jgi:hypothetical protein